MWVGLWNNIDFEILHKTSPMSWSQNHGQDDVENEWVRRYNLVPMSPTEDVPDPDALSDVMDGIRASATYSGNCAGSSGSGVIYYKGPDGSYYIIGAAYCGNDYVMRLYKHEIRWVDDEDTPADDEKQPPQIDEPRSNAGIIIGIVAATVVGGVIWLMGRRGG